ncbi:MULTISPECIES: hypothetical protein [Cyanophyceae]|uniref:hypothetical protein n=1 Tax=Cyanophyceae TaxID=3028117 RepID=UPI000C078796|nr:MULTISPECIES: hypothetical protein [Cyanophyceae]QCS48653.1 hypothetical protein FEK30_03960 [Picosynechococcus sp. PCC 11901]
MLTQLRIRSQVDQDGKVHIQMPPELMGQEIELLITVETEPSLETVEALGYPADFFETVAGGWMGEFERADQGEVTPRDWD